MAKIKNVILQISDADFRAIFQQLLEGNAEKSAFLLKFLREEKFTDAEIMDKLEVNPNAYYTLRSRLNQKIEEYLLQQLESPRAELTRKVANASELVFTKNKTIAIATLKKLEKELLEYDLSLHLTTVYNYLKKLHIDTPHYYEYSQLYNKHVAFMLALDKAESLVNEYTSKFANYYLVKDESLIFQLEAYLAELNNVYKLYEGHRLFVYRSIVLILHRNFVNKDFQLPGENSDNKQLFFRLDQIFEDFFIDPIYYHLKEVVEIIKFIVAVQNGDWISAELYKEAANNRLKDVSEYFGYYLFPGLLFEAKIKYAVKTSTIEQLIDEAEVQFKDFEADPDQFAAYVSFYTYRALSALFCEEFQEASHWLNRLLNELSFKNHNLAQMEIKMILGLLYGLMGETDLLNQLLNSLNRQIKLAGEEEHPVLVEGSKLLKLFVAKNKKQLQEKALTLVETIFSHPPKSFSPLLWLDKDWLTHLILQHAKS